MKKILRASLSAVLVLSLVGCGSTKDEAIYQDSIDAYVNEIDMDYAYDFTKTLSTDTSLHDNSLGFRTSGSDAEHRTANYLAKEMKAIGLKNVEKVPVNVDKWQYNDASLTIEGTDIDLMPVSYMVNGTDENGITAQIVDCGTGFAKDYEDKDVEGKIALVGVDQFNESWIGGYIYEAYEHGAKALVTYDLDGYGRFSDDDHQIQDVCAEDVMPTTIITMSEYKQIKKALKQGHDMATLKVDSVMEEGNGTSYDVVGYIPGKSHDQQIIFAGHYDMYQDIFAEPVKETLTVYDTLLLNKKLFSHYPNPDFGGSTRQNNVLVLGAKFETTDYHDIFTELAKVDAEIRDFFSRRHDISMSEYVKHVVRTHHRITVIHPFPEGNGRTSRAFMNVQLVRAGIIPVYIKVEDKKAYIDALARADALQDYDELYEIVFRLIFRSYVELNLRQE